VPLGPLRENQLLLIRQNRLIGNIQRIFGYRLPALDRGALHAPLQLPLLMAKPLFESP
jgi:hypothetical protein